MLSRVRVLRPLTASALLLAAAAFPHATPSVDPVMVAKIREEGLQHSKVMEFESYIADVLGARLTMSNDMKRAQGWVQSELKSIGLANVAAEPFMDYGVTWDNEYVSLHLLEPDYTPMVGYPIAHTASTNGKLDVSAVIVDLQSRDDLAKYRGTIKGNPDLLNAEEKMAFYKAEGVAVVLQCESGWLGAVRGYSRPGSAKDGWSREGMLNSVPLVAITPEHYNRMYRILKRGIPVKVEVDVRNKIGDRVEQAMNIVAEIPGSDLKDEIVMMGAHLDTWHASPNASDNTSGVAVVMEAARILKAVGAKPRRTIRIALWAGEEQGLFGSRAYVKKHFGNPKDSAVGAKAEYEKLSAYFNQDYGAAQYRGIYLQGNEQARAQLTAWMEPFRDLGMTTVSNQGVGSTDHISFDEVGLPGFQFLQDHTPGTGGHTNMDFLEGIQANDLMKNATIMASYVYHAAMADSRMPRKMH
ncbi:MAG: M20/M25/M40 family metallo-hydrolase [Gemmatimonadetes bacterium]|nr:M20/M25/M40 family metallo-hydrolase [Gemmatimonadota bacterium]